MSADRGEVPKGSAEIFFRKVKFWNDDEAEEAPPVFVRIAVFGSLGHSYLIYSVLCFHINILL
jgi:hypothetical protein